MRLSSATGIAHVRLALFSLTALVSSACFGQQLDPVQWSLNSDVQRVRPGDPIAFQLTATIEPGWHLDSLTTPQGGPIPTTAALKGSAIQSAAFYQPAPDQRFDQNFNLDTETFADKVPLLVSGVVPVGTTDGDVNVTTEVRYQACSDRQCLPPRKKTASLTILVVAAAPAQRKVQIPAGYALVAFPETPAPRIPDATPAAQSQAAVALFLLTAFGLGFAAVFTPCVFPMIPITVSFFLNRRGGIAQPATFAAGIVFLFCGLGLGVTALTGPFGVVRLGANPWVNGFIATVFGLFAISLLGAFEIALPSGLLTSLDHVSRREGYLGTLFVGLTFALTSFACVGPLWEASWRPPSRPRVREPYWAWSVFLPAFRRHSFSSRLSPLISRDCRRVVSG